MYAACGLCSGNEVGKEFDDDSGEVARSSPRVEELVFFSLPGESLSVTRRVGRREVIDVLADLSSVLPASVVSGADLEHGPGILSLPLSSSRFKSGSLSEVLVLDLSSQAEVMLRGELTPSNSSSLWISCL